MTGEGEGANFMDKRYYHLTDKMDSAAQKTIVVLKQKEETYIQKRQEEQGEGNMPAVTDKEEDVDVEVLMIKTGRSLPARGAPVPKVHAKGEVCKWPAWVPSKHERCCGACDAGSHTGGESSGCDSEGAGESRFWDDGEAR